MVLYVEIYMTDLGPINGSLRNPHGPMKRHKKSTNNSNQTLHRTSVMLRPIVVSRFKPTAWLVVGGLIAIVYSLRTSFSRGIDKISFTTAETTSNALLLSDLPGYTGWARPAATLSGHFEIKQSQLLQQQAIVNQDWSVVITCHGCAPPMDHDPLLMHSEHPWFYVRAYGPAILTGTVKPVLSSKFAASNQPQQDYQVTFHPTVVGQYWVEVVLTYSRPIEPEHFPLSDLQLPPPYYEGYVIPGFPLPVAVIAATDPRSHHQALVARATTPDYCTAKKLSIGPDQSWDDAAEDIRRQWSWRVTRTNRQSKYTNYDDVTGARTNVTLRGYQWGNNSLGFQAEYKHRDCRLHDQLRAAAAETECDNASGDLFSPKQKLRIILIGDSVMRLQKDHLEGHLDPSLVDVTFMELYGGALRCSRSSGPRVSDLVRDAAHDSRRTVIVVNTGMHDIHRLCGHTYKEDRATYLTAHELRISCLEVYRNAVQELVTTVQQVPAAIRIFQTTTAAWPKYGNYGIAWDPRYAQELPLDSAFVERFNRVAVEEIQKINQASPEAQQIAIVDAYWMTLARPDNRETNKVADIGKKLSHPGYEVIQFMVRVWFQTAVHRLCRLSL